MAKSRKAPSKALAVRPARIDGKIRKLKNDGWINPDTGFGTPRDKGASGFYCRTTRLNPLELEELYHFDAIAGRIVDEPVNEMFRKPFKVKVKSGTKQEEALEAAAKKLHAPARIKECKRLARLHGGAGLIMFTKEMETLATPLFPLMKTAAPSEVVALLALSADELRTVEYYTFQTALEDFQDINVIGTPRIYLAAPSGEGRTFNVHASRVIAFQGAYATRRMRRFNRGWSLSILERPYEVMRQFMQAFQATGGLLLDLSQAVFKMKGLWDMIIGGKHDKIQTRMAAVDKARSSIRAIVIDTEEEFKREATPLTGVPELIDRFYMLFAASIDSPISKFFGQSPAGLNATGASETRDWYDRLASELADDIGPHVITLYSRIGGPLKITEDDLEIEWPCLWQPTELEQAQIEKTKADAAHVRIDDGVLDPLEERQHMVGRSYESIIDADQAAKDLIEIGKQQAANPEPAAPAELDESGNPVQPDKAPKPGEQPPPPAPTKSGPALVKPKAKAAA